MVVPLDQKPTANLGFPRNFFKNSLDYSRASIGLTTCNLLFFCFFFAPIFAKWCTIPSELIADSCLQFDNSIIQEFEFLIGHGLPSHSLRQAQLGTKYGGLGLCYSKAHAAAAYLSSFLSSNLLAGQFLGENIQSSHFLSFLSCPVLTF